MVALLEDVFALESGMFAAVTVEIETEDGSYRAIGIFADTEARHSAATEAE